VGICVRYGVWENQITPVYGIIIKGNEVGNGDGLRSSRYLGTMSLRRRIRVIGLAAYPHLVIALFYI